MRKQSQADLPPIVHDLKKPEETDVETMPTSSKGGGHVAEANIQIRATGVSTRSRSEQAARNRYRNVENEIEIIRPCRENKPPNSSDGRRYKNMI